LSQNDNTTKRETGVREHPACVSRAAVRDKVRALLRETKTIDARIKELELQAAREADEARVLDLLAQRAELERRKEALPFLLTGAKVRALRGQAAALREEAAAVWAELQPAKSDVESATERIAELTREAEDAAKALSEATRRRDKLAGNYHELNRGALEADSDGTNLERGQPMMFRPDRFDEPE
jgi:chromosome segregation ATPase